jgi:hypothetical protein
MSEHGDKADAGINLRALAWGFAMIVAGIGFALLAAYFAYTALRPGQGYSGPNGALDFSVAAPRLESAPQPSYAAYAAGKERQASSYGWVDRKAGIARIPVEQAMQLMAQQAAPAAGSPAR